MNEDHSLAPIPPGLWYRAVSAVTRAVNLTLATMGVGTKPPSSPGASFAVVARKASAQDDLSAIARSPAVYAAVNRRAQSFATFPIRVYEGYGIGDIRTEPLDPDKVEWVASFLRTLELPAPGDLGQLFPTMPGEGLIGQLVADLLTVGNAYVIPTASPDGKRVVSLMRAHPLEMQLEAGGRRWRRQVQGGGPVEFYDRNAISHIRLVSWEAGGMGAMGTGAGSPLGQIIRGEAMALEKSADVIAQGGADLVVTGKTPEGIAYMRNAASRQKTVQDIGVALEARDGQRVIGIAGDVELTPIGLTPADIKAPEFLAAAKNAELMTLGVVPIAVGSEASTYAGGVIQMRVQLDNDEGIAALFEAYFLRPLAQSFARTVGKDPNPSRFTARFDLSQHPGAAAVRSEALARMSLWIGMGWTPEQAAGIEGLDVPKPLGAPPSKPPPSPTAAPSTLTPAMGEGAPKAPVGEAASRAADSPSRAEAWAARVALRAPHERTLGSATQGHLDIARDGYIVRAHAVLQKAATKGDRRNAGGTVYGPVDLDAILGPLRDALDAWIRSLSSSWGDAWQAGSDQAFVGAVIGPGVDVSTLPRARILPGDYQPLTDSCAFMTDFDRAEVSRIVQEGVDAGLSPGDIALELQQAETFSVMRALRVARTESARAQESGALRRYQRAEAAGFTVGREWLTSLDTHVRDTHRPMEGQIVGVGESFTYPSGATTMGPGLSGDPGEDCNERCCTRAVVSKA